MRLPSFLESLAAGQGAPRRPRQSRRLPGTGSLTQLLLWARLGKALNPDTAWWAWLRASLLDTCGHVEGSPDYSDIWAEGLVWVARAWLLQRAQCAPHLCVCGGAWPCFQAHIQPHTRGTAPQRCSGPIHPTPSLGGMEVSAHIIVYQQTVQSKGYKITFLTPIIAIMLRETSLT